MMNVPESNFVASSRVITLNSKVIAGYSCHLATLGSHGCLTAGRFWVRFQLRPSAVEVTSSSPNCVGVLQDKLYWRLWVWVMNRWLTCPGFLSPACSGFALEHVSSRKRCRLSALILTKKDNTGPFFLKSNVKCTWNDLKLVKQRGDYWH